MSTWKELPRPATPGPWTIDFDPEDGPHGSWHVHYPLPPTPEERKVNALACVALPEYVAEVERLRDIIDNLYREGLIGPMTVQSIRKGLHWADDGAAA